MFCVGHPPPQASQVDRLSQGAQRIQAGKALVTIHTVGMQPREGGHHTLLQFMFVLTERVTLKMFHIRIARDAVPPTGFATSETEVSFLAIRNWKVFIVEIPDIQQGPSTNIHTNTDSPRDIYITAIVKPRAYFTQFLSR